MPKQARQLTKKVIYSKIISIKFRIWSFEMEKSLYRKFTYRMLRDHLILFVVSFIFIIFFGNFMSAEKPERGVIFSAFTVIGYLILIVSDVTGFARRDFLNEKGNLEKLDQYMGFKCGLMAQIPSFILLVALFIFSLFDSNVANYINMGYRSWMVVYLGFFPSDAGYHYWLYLIMAAIPVLTAGITYWVEIRRSKVYLRK